MFRGAGGDGRLVLTVMRRKVSSSPSPEVASDTDCACAMVRSTATGSEGATAPY